MKRLVVAVGLSLAAISLHQFININLGAFDLTKRVRNVFFKSLRADPEVDTTIVILNIDSVGPDEAIVKVKELELSNPKIIGVNLCDSKNRSEVLDNYLRQSKKIRACDCSSNSNKRTSRITSNKNEVTHFSTDRDSYFELQLADRTTEFKERNNHKELINFRTMDRYYRGSLKRLKISIRLC